MTAENDVTIAALGPLFLFGLRGGDCEEAKESGMHDQGNQGTRSVGGTLLHGTCDEPGVEGIESVWRVRAVRRGRGELGSDFASAGEVHDVPDLRRRLQH